jgi:ribonuclease HI
VENERVDVLAREAAEAIKASMEIR